MADGINIQTFQKNTLLYAGEKTKGKKMIDKIVRYVMGYTVERFLYQNEKNDGKLERC